MNELQTEIAELKADRAATKEKEKREAWTKYVSLSVVIIAVFAAIAAQWGGKYSSQVMLTQAQASDQWAFYQAKSIKQHLDEVTLTQLASSANADDSKAVADIQKFKDAVARYDKEKAEIKAKAEALETKREAASRHGGRMGMAISFFSVAIAIASICLVTKKKPLWFVALILASVAIYEMAMAWMV